MEAHSQKRLLSFGEHLPFIKAVTRHNPQFAIGSLGGRYLMLAFIAHDGEDARATLSAMVEALPAFDAQRRVLALAAFEEGILSSDAADVLRERALVFEDKERALFNAIGLADCSAHGTGQPEDGIFLFDPTLRVMASWPLGKAKEAFDIFPRLGPPEAHAGVPQCAPVLIAPRIFEPAFCQHLIQHYHEQGSFASGVTREKDGLTTVELDNSVKKRFDCTITDETLQQAIMQRIYWRLAPHIEKAFQFKVTRMERYIVSCYDSATGGYFKAHRDNTTKGTAHRRFAVSINLNAEDYEGGDLMFPEFGTARYRAPTGGAVVFSCSLLHEATPIIKGQRFAFLPFLYDEEGARIREANAAFLDEKTVGRYSAKPDSAT